VIAPIREALLMGGSLALLTHPLLFAPFDRWLHAAFPSWPTAYRRYFSSLIATALLAATVILALLLVLWALLGRAHETVTAAIGLVFQDPARIHTVIDALAARFQLLLDLYPSLGLTQQDIRDALTQFLGHSRFGPEFVRMLFTGTGGLIVEAVLTLVTLFYLYSQGPALARYLLDHLPLSPTQQLALRLRFHRTVQHLLAETVGKALAIGILLGSIAWAIAGFNPVLVAVVGLFVGLMPVVGHAFVWLPLASLLASQGHWLDAACLAVASWTAAWLIERAAQRMAMALGTDETWLSFLLFLSVVGGALGYGVRGLIIGPASVITVVLIAEFINSLYAKEPDAEG
jgi:predicted PurR-regulated permease PerM